MSTDQLFATGAKSKKNKKKNQANKQNTDSEHVPNNEAQAETVAEQEENEDDDQQTKHEVSPAALNDSVGAAFPSLEESRHLTRLRRTQNKDQTVDGGEQPVPQLVQDRHKRNNTSGTEPAIASIPAENAENHKFDDLVRDRDSLRAEVTELRKSLEQIQHKHEEEMEALQQRLNESDEKKTQAETQFQKLLERVNTIKSQLGERLKEDAVRLPV